ncbi:RHS repeat domain-containing protein [Chryseobacterium carnipullorum]|uniref:RHS repeat domain-containing protein n=1 Tax=Chryseobacterium carnipullorum TaxID=1124835 RepID=UPI0023F4C25C|nr:RHS repeat-associated core domain-containing protein [Chryseobacterium carnipullorum]
MEYFPSGETFVENHRNSNYSPYKFNGKELDAETGYYYYGARYYNPRISLWLSPDPLAEKYPCWSPYNYTFNNPIIYTDPDGRDPIITITNQVVGWGHIKLIGADGRGRTSNYVTIGVPLYRAIITDDEDASFRMETMVTRDSWKVEKMNGNTATISNLANQQMQKIMNMMPNIMHHILMKMIHQLMH